MKRLILVAALLALGPQSHADSSTRYSSDYVRIANQIAKATTGRT